MQFPTIELETARLEQLRARWQPKLIKQVITALNEGQPLKPLLSDFPKFNSLEKIDLRGIDLSHQHLTGPAGKGVDFSHTNLWGAKFHQTKIENGRFIDADLTRADFSESELDGADFSHSLASHASFRQAKIHYGKFHAAKLNGANFTGADLTGSDFARAQARQSCFRASQLAQVNFSEATLAYSDFRNAIFQGTAFVKAQLEAADLRGTATEQAIWRGVHAKTALIDPGQPAIHHPSGFLSVLRRFPDGLEWLLQHIGNLAKLILLITFIWLLFWIYHRISPPDANTVELIPFEVVINGQPEKEYGIFLTNKLIESRNTIFAGLERVQGSVARSMLSDPALEALKNKLSSEETEGETELVLEYRSGEIVNQKLMLSNLSNYRRFEKYSFPMTDFQVLQFIFDLRRVRTTNPVLSGTFNRSENHIKAVVRLEQGDRTLGIWALDSSAVAVDDVALVHHLALQMVRDELGQWNPFFADVPVVGFAHFLQGMERLNDYLELKKYQNVASHASTNLLTRAKSDFEQATAASFRFAPAFYYLGIVNFELGKTNRPALETCIENYQTTWKLLVQQLSQLAAHEAPVNLYQETRENLTNTLYNLAQAYHFNSRYFTASSRGFAENIQTGIDFYFEAMRFDSLNSNIYVNLAEAYKKLQKIELAEKYYALAIDRGATDAENYFQLGNLLALQGGDKLAEAVQQLEQATTAAPRNPLFQFTLGELYLKTAQLELAEQAFSTVYRLIEKNDAGRFFFFGQKFFKDELFEFAVIGFSRADSLLAERRQINPQLKFNLGLSLHQLKNYQAAIPYFIDARQFDQFKGSASYNLACAYSRLENIPEACYWLNLALQLDAVSRDMAELDDDLALVRESECFKKMTQP